MCPNGIWGQWDAQNTFSSSINWVLFEEKHWKKNNSCGVNVSPVPGQQAFARGGECLATARKTKAAAFL